MQAAFVRKRGTIVVPAKIRRKFGFEDGSQIVFEEKAEGALLRKVPNKEPEIEIYTPERLAEFFLNNVMTKDGYEEARQDVLAMGIDPDTIDHYRWAE